MSEYHAGREDYGFSADLGTVDSGKTYGNTEGLAENTQANFYDREREASSEKLLDYTKKLGDITNALSVKNERVSKELRLILDTVNSMEPSEALSLLEDTVSNPYFEIEGLVRYDSEDLDTVAGLLQGFTALDRKGRNKVMNEIADV